MITFGDVEYRRDESGRWGLVVEDNPKSDWAVSPVLAAALDEIERLQSIVDRLPKTADGVPIAPGMHLWRDGCQWGDIALHFGEPQDVSDDGTSEVRINTYRGWFPSTEFYSTREAAEKARTP